MLQNKENEAKWRHIILNISECFRLLSGIFNHKLLIQHLWLKTKEWRWQGYWMHAINHLLQVQSQKTPLSFRLKIRPMSGAALVRPTSVAISLNRASNSTKKHYFWILICLTIFFPWPQLGMIFNKSQGQTGFTIVLAWTL